MLPNDPKKGKTWKNRNETASDAQRRTMPRQQRAFESDLATCTGCGLLSNSVANAQFFHAFNYVYKGT